MPSWPNNYIHQTRPNPLYTPYLQPATQPQREENSAARDMYASHTSRRRARGYDPHGEETYS